MDLQKIKALKSKPYDIGHKEVPKELKGVEIPPPIKVPTVGLIDRLKHYLNAQLESISRAIFSYIVPTWVWISFLIFLILLIIIMAVK